MSKYIKGPYKLSGSENIMSEIISIDVLDRKGFPVAELPMTAIMPDYMEKLDISHWAHAPGEAFIERDPGDVLATAHLFKAAPELYEVLKALIGELAAAEWGTPEHAEEILTKVIRYYDSASAAIAKAEGRI